MRRFLVPAIAFVLSIFISELALAVSSRLSGSFNKDQIQGTCKREGGQFYSEWARYGCVKQGCDKNQPKGPNNYCAVQCVGDKCDGVTPASIVPPGQSYRGDLGSILSNGANKVAPPKESNRKLPAVR